MAKRLVLFLDIIVTLPDGINSPTDLSQIYQTTRKQHDELKLNGLISFDKGLYLHIFEGDEQSVTQFFKNDYIRSKESNRIIIIDTIAPNAHFPSYTLKLDSNIKNNALFLSCLESCKADISSIDSSVAKKLEPFFDYKTIINNQVTPEPVKKQTASVFTDKLLSIPDWPDFTQVQQSFIAIDVCSRLLTKKVPYQDLASNRDNKDLNEMNALLKQLDEIGLLEKSTPPKQESKPNAQILPKQKKRSSFYKKMKSFLKIRS